MALHYLDLYEVPRILNIGAGGILCLDWFFQEGLKLVINLFSRYFYIENQNELFYMYNNSHVIYIQTLNILIVYQ